MEGLIIWLVVAGLAVVAAVVVMRRRRSRLSPGVAGLDPDDLDELNTIARRVAAEEAVCSALVRHLRLIESRGVPVRRVDPTDWPERWYLGFADGSAVVIGARDPGVIIGVRGTLCRYGTLHVVGVRPTPAGMWLELRSGRARHEVLAVADA